VITLLIAIAFTSIYLYVLNYREMRAGLREGETPPGRGRWRKAPEGASS
jgi:hypothetical protein